MIKTRIKFISSFLAAAVFFSSIPAIAFANDESDENADVIIESSVVDASTEETTTTFDVELDESEEDSNVESVPEDETEPTEEVVDEIEEIPIEETTVPTEETEEIVETEPIESEVIEPTEETEETEDEIIFDHYYSDIDESLVQTADLFVQVDDASVFTANTNIVSNYDNVYIISCESVEEARYVYSYYIDKVTNITDLSNVMSLCSDTDAENTSDGTESIDKLNDMNATNLTGYIALIDSGANANFNYSVIDDDTTDQVGHGTQMVNYILEENPAARIASIKVTNGNAVNAADVYAGIKFAIESNVSIINISMVGLDIEKNAIVKDVIQEAIDNDIVVIGAAGNYNSDATKYIPGCIEDVVTIGACNEDGTKYPISNYNADLYVIANSTSEAAARYTGIYSLGGDSDKVFYTLTDAYETAEDDDSEIDGDVEGYDFDLTANEYAVTITVKVKTGIPTQAPSSSFDTYAKNVKDASSLITSVKQAGTYTESGTSKYYASVTMNSGDFSSGIGYYNAVTKLHARGGVYATLAIALNKKVSDNIGNNAAIKIYSNKVWWVRTIVSGYKYRSDEIEVYFEDGSHKSYDCTNYCTDPGHTDYDSSLSGWKYIAVNDFSNRTVSGNFSSMYSVSAKSLAKVLSYNHNAAAQTYVWGSIKNYRNRLNTGLARYKATKDSNIKFSPTKLAVPSDSGDVYTHKTTLTKNPKTFSIGGYKNNSIINLSTDESTVITLDTSKYKTYKVTVTGSGITAKISGNKLTITVTDAVAAKTAKIKVTAVGASPDHYNNDYVIRRQFNGTSQDRIEGVFVRESVYLSYQWSASFKVGTPVEFTKSATNDLASVVDHNNYYTLKGTTYQVYTNSTCTTELEDGTITFDKYGETDDLVILEPGKTYYLKELNAEGKGYPSRGYELDKTIYKLVVNANGDNIALYDASEPDDPLDNYGLSGGSISIPLEDNPLVDPVQITLSKHTTQLNNVDPTSFYGTTFRIEFYGDVVDFDDELTNKHESLSGFTPLWVGDLVLDSNNTTVVGKNLVCEINIDTLKSIEPKNGSYQVYFDNIPNEIRQLPLGTYRIYEIKAPQGWEVNADVIRAKLYQQTADGFTNHRIYVESVYAGDATSSLYSVTSMTANADLVLDETISTGYLGLTKTSTTGTVEGFEYQLYGTYNGTQTLFATGITDEDGIVNWTYETEYKSAESREDLYGETDQIIELPVYDNDGLISYEIREIIDTTKFGSSNLPFIWEIPEGWTKNTDGTYFYIDEITLENNDSRDNYLAKTIHNDRIIAEYELTKSVSNLDSPENFNFSIWSGTTKIATGVSDSTGKVIWTYNIVNYNDPRTGESLTGETTSLLSLPAGTYEVREEISSYTFEDSDVPYTWYIPTGWSKSSDGKYFYKSVTLTGSITGNTSSDSITNTQISSSLNIIKVEHSGDNVSKTFTFDIYYRGNGATASTTKKLLKTVTITTTNSEGKVTINNIPEGWYEIIERNESNDWIVNWTNTDTVEDGNKLIHIDSQNQTIATPTFDDGVKENGTALENTVLVYNDVKPTMGTTAVDGSTEIQLSELSETATLVDTVSYTNIFPGTYRISGVVYDKNTGEPMKINGETVTGHADLTIEEELDKYGNAIPKSGTKEVEFTLDTTTIPGATLVVFEEMFELNGETVGKLIVDHKDINDIDQTLYIPELHTTAHDKLDYDNIVDGTQTSQTIVDTVHYTNLIPNKEYTVSGKLVIKSTEEYVTDEAGNPITASTTFTPTEAEGDVELEFTFDASKYAGEKIVVFENCYYNNILVGAHADINDKDQTIDVGLILHVKIAKVQADKVSYVLSGAEITIYEVTLDDEGNPIKDENGNIIYTVAKDLDGKDCVGTTDSDGFVDFKVNYKENVKYFAKETKAPKGYNINDNYFEVIPTKEREELGVCLIEITIPDTIILIPPKTGDDMNIGLYITLAMLSMTGILAGITIFKKKKEF